MVDRRGEAVPAPGASTFSTIIWYVWPAMAWALPIMTAIVLMTAELGLMQIAAMLAMLPLLVVLVVVALLVLAGTLPRRHLVRAGWTTAPAAVIPLLILHWGFVVAGILTYDSDPERGGRPSIVQQVTGSAVAPWTAWLMFSLGLFAWLASCLALSGADRTRSAGRGTIIASAIAVAVVLASLVVAPLGYSSQHANEIHAEAILRDSAGLSPSEIRAMPRDEQRELLDQRYEHLQSTWSAVRALIAEDGWSLRAGVDRVYDYTTYPGGESDCAFESDRCYMIEAAGTVASGTPIESVITALEADGWVPMPTEDVKLEDYGATNAEGIVLTIAVTDDGVVSTHIHTSSFWGDADTLATRTLTGAERPVQDETRYAANEWPDLATL